MRFSGSLNAGLLLMSADTATASGDATGDVTTNTAAATTATTPAAKPKRGRGAAGTSVFPVANEEAGKLLAKEKGGKFTLFKVDSPTVSGLDSRFFVSNHRNAVQHSVMTADGYKVAGAMGTNAKPADPTKVKAKAEKAMDQLSEDDRRALFLKYMGNGGMAAVNASAEPAVAPRNDTSAEFAASENAKKAPAANVVAPAPVAKATGTSTAKQPATTGKKK